MSHNHVVTASETSKHQDLVERYGRSVLYPWTAQSAAQPYRVVDAKGVYLWLDTGEKILDFRSQLFSANLGHGHEGMKKAIAQAAQKACVPHPEGIDEERLWLAETLKGIAPKDHLRKLGKVFFTLSGAEANENAVKMARLVTGKHKVITRYRSYHGATLATINMSGDYRRIPFDGAMTGIIRFPDPYPRGSRQTIDTVTLLEEIIEIEGPETIACILLEGITGANGVFIPDQDYWPRIRALCDRYNILLISDEVLSGFGRTGTWFAIDHYGVAPDMITMAKGLTAGYAPLGAVLVSDAIAKRFDEETLWCGLTNYGHPLCCAIANAALRFYQEEHVFENVQARGRELTEMLSQLQKENPLVAETRSIGLLAAIDLRKGKNNDEPLVPYRAKGDDLKKAKWLATELRRAGVFTIVRFGTLLLSPPLCISKEELRDGMERIGQVLTKLA